MTKVEMSQTLYGYAYPNIRSTGHQYYVSVPWDLVREAAELLADPVPGREALCWDLGISPLNLGAFA
jgi:hypothetical protein